MNGDGVARVVVTRGSAAESVHRVHIVVADAAGAVRAAAGDPRHFAFWRSAAKPVQALCLVESGAADAFDLEAADLAIACGSHTGTPAHVAAARRLLGRAGREPADLACGPHAPEDAAAAAALSALGLAPQPLHNNCSGKHAGMIAACVHAGWPIAGYRSPGHPLQRWIQAAVRDVTGVEPVVGVDGCGVPTFGMPLAAMAVAYARLASGTGLTARRAAAAGRLGDAMAAHPEAVAGPGYANTLLLALHGDRLLTKGGAEGVWCAGLRGPGSGLGIALKVEDGAGRASVPALCAVLSALDLPGGGDPRLAGVGRPELRNTLGEVVGILEADLPAGFAAARQGTAGPS